MKYALFGAGNRAHTFLSWRGIYNKSDIVGLVDNDLKKWGKNIKGYTIENPKILHNKKYDFVIVCPMDNKNIVQELENIYNVDKQKIISLDDYYENIVNILYKKNCDSVEKEKVLKDIKNKGLNVYGDYRNADTKPYEVFWDSDSMPFINIYNKRMYFPKDYKFIMIDGKEYVEDIEYEQGKGSPHQYYSKVFGDLENAVLVDGGVREGNFSLKHVEKCKKLILVEAERIWAEALSKTFRPWKGKVEIFNKFLGRDNNRDYVSLDTICTSTIDFLKLDIEGAEVDALLGGKNILKKSNCNIAVCSYHRKNDEENIRFILENLGYKTSTSDGYMIFMYDPYFSDSMDLRKGVVYAKKEVI